MKSYLKPIATAVIVAMTVLFAYQTWWLARMYRSEVLKTENAVIAALRTCDFNEMMYRLQRVGEEQAAEGFTGDIAVGAVFRKNGSLSAQITAPRYRGAMRGNHQSTTYRFTQEDDGIDQGENNETLEHVSAQMIRGIRAGIDDVDNNIDFGIFDSLLVISLKEYGLDGNHKVELVMSVNGEESVLKEICTEGYLPTNKSVSYEYVYDVQETAMYRLWIEPVGKAVLKQMTGILVASVLILIVLVAVFLYLIHIIRTQKSLDELKSDFTNNMTHELKTPISVAYAANDALLNFPDEDSPEQRRKYLEISQNQLEHLSGLVEQILSMSMERRKGLVLRKEDICLADMVADLTNKQKMRVEKPVTFDVEIVEGTTINADRMHLGNILNNLLDNAIKYSGETVTISIKADERHISIKDNGIGISESDLKHIFEKFYRAHTGNIHDVKGYGLGLYYVKSIVEKHGWTITAKSEPGKGTTFTIHWA